MFLLVTLRFLSNLPIMIFWWHLCYIFSCHCLLQGDIKAFNKRKCLTVCKILFIIFSKQIRSERLNPLRHLPTEKFPCSLTTSMYPMQLFAHLPGRLNKIKFPWQWYELKLSIKILFLLFLSLENGRGVCVCVCVSACAFLQRLFLNWLLTFLCVQ